MYESYGQTLGAAQAAPVLAAAGVTRESEIGPDGMPFTSGGVSYLILQYTIDFPGPTAHSPDGRHTVYRLSKDELAARKPEPSFMDKLEEILGTVSSLALLVAGVWIVSKVKTK